MQLGEEGIDVDEGLDPSLMSNMLGALNYSWHIDTQQQTESEAFGSKFTEEKILKTW